MSVQQLQPNLLSSLIGELAQSLSNNPASGAPVDWEPWLKEIFPSYVTKPFADHHRQLWEWVWELKLGIKSRPLIEIISRGGGKSSSAELSAALISARKSRRYLLYVRSTQEQADKSVENIATILESPVFAKYYPDSARRQLNKYGQSKGWRRNRLRTASGFTVDAYGLDTALRGAKVDENRPDAIWLDDIDQKHDSIKTTLKKIEQITTSILPAGSTDVAVLGIQNLILSNGVFARMVNNEADFLLDRILVGPIPAVRDLQYESILDRKTKRYHFVITGGEPTWEGQDLQKCQDQINTWGILAFLVEAQHDVDVVEGGTYSGVEFRRAKWTDVPELKRIVVWVDPAVSDSDDSDAMGVQIDGIGEDKVVYRLYSWEDRTSPRNVIRRALSKAWEFGASEVGFETDQGGILWRDEYYAVHQSMIESGELPRNYPRPTFKHAKAGSIGSKRHRHNMMRAAYDRGEFVHVMGTHNILENGLKRFPINKPFDLCDAAFWSWRSLRAGAGWSLGMSE